MRVSGEQWHSDQSCAEFPPAYSVLYQEIIPPDGGGDTMFLSAYKAYEELSPSMKVYLEGKTATHDGARVFDKGSTRSWSATRKAAANSCSSTASSPAISTRSRRARAAARLSFLYDHLERPHWTMRFRWTPHAVAMWDNRCVQHYAIWDYWPNVRLGYRMFTKGTERPRDERTAIVMTGLVPASRVFDAGRRTIGIGGSLAASPLPHHRTYGSVSGGSMD